MKIGSSLGRYRITSKIGEGGMGQVFLGEDDRLHRHVAIKILPPEFRGDGDRLARMEREAHALAQLEHPNIAAIYGLEEAIPEGEQRAIPFLVMQYAEGETLAARLSRGRLPVDEAVAIALQIARALEAAHDEGIIHRDLKPANVVLSGDGKVTLLDFGLAKAFGKEPGGSLPADAAMSPTEVGGTRAGIILGTAGYMSPEQARGKTVDRRTDVWAFGCVMFELLSGQSVFPGETVTDVLGAIVHRDPEWQALPADTPPAIRSLLERCLRKNSARRIQSIGDVRLALEEYRENPAADDRRVAPPQPARSRRAHLVPWALAALVTAAATALVVFDRGATPPLAVSRFSVEIGEAPIHESMPALAVSSDGSRVAMVLAAATGRRLVVRPIDQLTGSEISSPGSPYNPFFSPDGQWVGFVTPTALLKAPSTGGTALTLTAVNRSRGATWTDDDTIVVAAGFAEGLSRVPASGGELTPLTTLAADRGEVTHRWPHYVRGHDVVLFTAHTQTSGAFDNATIEAVNLKTNERKTVYRGGAFGRYLPTGHLVFVNKDVLYAIPFDIRRLEVTGSPSPVAQEVTYSNLDGFAQFSSSDSGLAVYRRGRGGAPTYEALWVDARGEQTPLWKGARTYGDAHLSPDGTKVSFMVYADGDWDVWVYDRARDVATRLTFAQGLDGPGIWSPDGRYIAYSSGASGGGVSIYRKRADGSGEAERITDSKVSQYVSSWSADGKHLLYTESSDLWIVPVDGDRTPRQFLSTPFNESEGAFSPDNRWIAYQSNESGRVEVYVRPVSGAGKWQISEGGGAYPRWSGDGRRLFFRDNDGIMTVPITIAGDSIEVGRAQRALKGNYRGGSQGIAVGGLTVADYAATRDGSHFVLYQLDEAAAGSAHHLVFVLNWFTELQRLLPSRN